MFIARVNRRRAFTLLEIIIAVVILATMALAIYRFVQSNLVAIRASSGALASDARYEGLREALTAQWQSLSDGIPGKPSLFGDAFKLNDRSRDEISWICSAGPGLMTRYASGEYVVSLRLQSQKNSDRLDLGLLRTRRNDSVTTEVEESWIPLIDNVRGLQIRYFDAQFNVWKDSWKESRLPHLVKLTVGRFEAGVPWEAVIPITRTPFKQ